MTFSSKRILTIVACFALACGLLIGCSQESKGPDYKDKAFLTDMGKALDARWDKVAEQAKSGTAGSVSALKEAIQAEQDVLAPYKSAVFEDSKLHELALQYINALDKTMETADLSQSSDYSTYQQYEDAYNNRVMALNTLLSSYEITTADRHKSTREDLLSKGKAAQTTSDDKAALQKIAENIQIVFEEDAYGYISGKATATNTTGKTYDYVSFNVALYNDAGVRIDQSYLGFNNWAAGETVVQDVYVSNKEMPASYKIMLDSYVEKK